MNTSWETMMSCCSTKQSKPKAEESRCQGEQNTQKAAEELKSGCGCAGGKESAPKKEEPKKTSCC